MFIQRQIKIGDDDNGITHEDAVLTIMEEFPDFFFSNNFNHLSQILASYSISAQKFKNNRALLKALMFDLQRLDKSRSFIGKSGPQVRNYYNNSEWIRFIKSGYKIAKKASLLTQQIAEPRLVGRQKSQEHKPIAYVANILTTPGRKLQDLIDHYACEGIAEQYYGSFAMVIGLNTYRSLDGESELRLLESLKTAENAPFSCAIIPFLWDFSWGEYSFHEVQQAYNQMGAEAQNIAKHYERSKLFQSTVPYGQLREKISVSHINIDLVNELRKTHEAVYIHLADDDAVSLFARDSQMPLLDRYSFAILAELEKNNKCPHLVVGGYEFRTGDTGDLRETEADELLTEIASKLDTWFRKILAEINPDFAYPTEPNMVFLAADKTSHYLAQMCTPDVSEKCELDDMWTMFSNRIKNRGGIKQSPLAHLSPAYPPEMSTGLLYGRGRKEGDKLRKRIIKVLSLGRGQQAGKSECRDQKQEQFPVTRYDPNLGIATSSRRFTLRDRDQFRHDETQTYGILRKEANAKGKGAFIKRIVEDILTIKQSHIGSLAKELQKIENGDAIAESVYDAIATLLFAILTKASVQTVLKTPLVEEGSFASQINSKILEHICELNLIAQELKAVIEQLRHRYD